MDNEEDRQSVLVQGIYLRGRQIPLHSQNFRYPSRNQLDTIRIKNFKKMFPYLLMMDKLSGLSGWKDGIFKEYLEKSLEWTALRPLRRL